ncbi:hypothetical protein T492DRAFT_909502 [Pavlovales sp. CCMP2436]|nr:hypothetical protein T492DRAFT_909502 [Pavlovales sp. CCMP2436]|mmetsp:Transcript_3890/g.9854  ORF Transcript_3890/g.9854 Transcript_3890/m.9854 type:complete len:240 (-) Transcript_3890:100-819(-)
MRRVLKALGRKAGSRVRVHGAAKPAAASVDAALLRARAAAAMRALDVGEYALDLWLADDAWMRSLNRGYLQKDYATDVLSFPYAHENGDGAQAAPVAGKVPAASHRADARLGDVMVGLAAARAATSARSETANVPGEQVARGRGCYGRLYAAPDATPLALDDVCWLLAVHGICHLLGYTHDDELSTATMIDAEEKALEAAASAGAIIKPGSSHTETAPHPTESDHAARLQRLDLDGSPE